MARSAAVGSVIAAVAASSCCMLPLALFTLGASGAWIGTLVRLAPFQPYLISAAVACLGSGYWLVYRAGRITCARDQACKTSAAGRFVKGALVLSTVLIAFALGFKVFISLLDT
ncbi:mercuric transporter MerT family protein [Bradyrhizobium cenepequi]|uniref:mercuric transporter MerT family protein n=1 Tax=Bradyrhizobium cenepequi TaxID=2821403 RepID=UPI001CE34DC4|nr:mercuric transporter MerT family protein [Bradyrhizobium cenepequi]